MNKRVIAVLVGSLLALIAASLLHVPLTWFRRLRLETFSDVRLAKYAELAD